MSIHHVPPVLTQADLNLLIDILAGLEPSQEGFLNNGNLIFYYDLATSKYAVTNTFTGVTTSNADALTVLNAALTLLPLNSLGGRQGRIVFLDPVIDLDGNFVVPAYSKIMLEGVSPNDDYAMQETNFGERTGGTILRYIHEAAGDIITVTAGGTHSEPAGMCSWIGLKNITLRYSDIDYTGKALDLSGAYGFALENVVCDVEWSYILNAPPADSYGIYCPHSGNERRTMKNVVAVGYQIGMFLESDHLTTENIEAYYCYEGIRLGDGYGQSHLYIHTAYCQKHITFGFGDLTHANFGAIHFEDNVATSWFEVGTYGFWRNSGGWQLTGSVGILTQSIADTRIADWSLTNSTSDTRLVIGHLHILQAGVYTMYPFDEDAPVGGLKFDTMSEVIPILTGTGKAYITKGGALTYSTGQGLGVKDADGYYVEFEHGRILQEQKASNVELGNGVDHIDITLPIEEPNSAYIVLYSLDWNTTSWISAKTNTGFTVSFGTVTPDANRHIHWFLAK